MVLSHLSLNEYTLYNFFYSLISLSEREVASIRKAINHNNDYLVSIVPELQRTLRHFSNSSYIVFPFPPFNH